jgi:hypothetical protein
MSPAVLIPVALPLVFFLFGGKKDNGKCGQVFGSVSALERFVQKSGGKLPRCHVVVFYKGRRQVVEKLLRNLPCRVPRFVVASPLLKISFRWAAFFSSTEGPGVTGGEQERSGEDDAGFKTAVRELEDLAVGCLTEGPVAPSSPLVGPGCSTLASQTVLDAWMLSVVRPMLEPLLDAFAVPPENFAASRAAVNALAAQVFAATVPGCTTTGSAATRTVYKLIWCAVVRGLVVRGKVDEELDDVESLCSDPAFDPLSPFDGPGGEEPEQPSVSDAALALYDQLIRPNPTPGYLYKVRSTDKNGLSGVVQRALPGASGNTRANYMAAVAAAPWNAALYGVEARPTQTTGVGNVDGKRVSIGPAFLPNNDDVRRQLRDTATVQRNVKWKRNSKGQILWHTNEDAAFGTLWLPPLDDDPRSWGWNAPEGSPAPLVAVIGLDPLDLPKPWEVDAS